MSVAFLNDTTITSFINDTKIFDKCVKESFKQLDVDKDGFLNADELRVGFRNSSLEFESLLDPMDDVYEAVSHKYQVDENGGIDEEEFKSIIIDILLSMARGIGNFPIEVAVHQGSFLMKAVEYEKEKEEK